MRRVHLLALLLAGWWLAGVPVAAAETAGPKAWPKAWVIRDSDTEITLFGTIHALPKDTPWASPGLAARLGAADTLVVEALLPDDPAAMGAIIGKIGLRGDGKPMAARLSSVELKKVEAAATREGVPMAALDRMETWLAALTLGNAGLARSGITTVNGVEPQLLARARAGGKAITALETIEQQLGFFAGLPDADQRAMLMATVAEADNIAPAMASMVGLWQAGNVDTIAAEFDKELQATPLMRQRLIVDRNARWADWIAGVMRRPGKVVVAVGAGHLGGADGLLARLAAKGFAPDPLPPEAAAP